MKTAIKAHVSKRDALRYMGYRGQAVDERFLARVETIALQVGALVAHGVYEAFPIAGTDNGGAVLAGIGLRLPGKSIAKHLKGAKEAVLLAVTLGFESERIIRQYGSSGTVDGLIADSCASSLAEDAARMLAKSISEEYGKSGKRCGRRFSPGYGDFPLSIQPKFVKAIGADRQLGIMVTQGDLMVPAKSITAVIPVFCYEAEDLSRKTSAQVHI